MDSHKKLTLSCLISLSIIGLSFAVNPVTAQNNNTIVEESNPPLDDQVKFIGELESRSSADWNFAMGEGVLLEETYHRTMSQPEVRLVEQVPPPPPQWTNMGRGTNYTILVDVYRDKANLEK